MIKRRCVVFALGGLLLSPLSPLQAQRWSPDDRVLLTSFHLVSGLARGEQHLYAASSEGLQILDMVSRRWELPSTAEDGFPLDEQPSAVAFDPLDRRVWLATLEGSLYSYQVDLQRWTLESSPGLGPLLRAAWLEGPSESGLYVRSPSGWFFMSGFSLTARQIPADELPGALIRLEFAPEERLARTDPAFASARGTLLMDEHAQRWPLTDFVSAPRQGLFWLATAGDDLYLYDARFVSTEPYRYGLLSTSARSLAGRDGTIWFGGDGVGPRKGVTRGSSDLQEWRWYEARTSGAPGVPVTDLVVGEEAVWFGTRGGVYRLKLAGEEWERVGGPAADVPVNRLARAPDGAVWAATDRGVLRVDAKGSEDAELAAGPGLNTLLLVGDTLWVAGDTGPRRFLTSGESLGWPVGEPPPSQRIVDLARTGEDVWAADSRGALWKFGRGGWVGPLREASQGGVGQIQRLRARDEVLWVAGSGGVGRRDPDSGEWTYLLAGRDLVGTPVWDVLPDDDVVFVATPRGVMRLAWREAF